FHVLVLRALPHQCDIRELVMKQMDGHKTHVADDAFNVPVLVSCRVDNPVNAQEPVDVSPLIAPDGLLGLPVLEIAVAGLRVGDFIPGLQTEERGPGDGTLVAPFREFPEHRLDELDVILEVRLVLSHRLVDVEAFEPRPVDRHDVSLRHWFLLWGVELPRSFPLCSASPERRVGCRKVLILYNAKMEYK